MGETLEFIVKHGYLVLFGSVLPQQLRVPLPSTPFIVAAGALAHSGQLNWAEVLLLACSALLTDLNQTCRFPIGFARIGARYLGNF